MFSDLFDNPWKILIIAIVILVLFGGRKLPAAARSLGQSMRILKTEVQGLRDDDEPTSTTTSTSTAQVPPAQLEPVPSVTAAQAQIDALSQQIASLQETVAASHVPSNNVADSSQAK
jgi:sec-independent protein translocase protein TatA